MYVTRSRAIRTKKLFNVIVSHIAFIILWPFLFNMLFIDTSWSAELILNNEVEMWQLRPAATGPKDAEVSSQDVRARLLNRPLLSDMVSRINKAVVDLRSSYKIQSIARASFEEALKNFRELKDDPHLGQILFYRLNQPPTKLEMVELSKLESEYEVALFRIKETNEWIIIKGTKDDYVIPNIIKPYSKSGLIDISIHSGDHAEVSKDKATEYYPSIHADIFLALIQGGINGIITPKGILLFHVRNLTHPEKNEPWFPSEAELEELALKVHSTPEEKQGEACSALFEKLSVPRDLVPWDKLSLEQIYEGSAPSLIERLTSKNPLERTTGLNNVTELLGIQAMDILSSYHSDPSILVRKAAVENFFNSQKIIHPLNKIKNGEGLILTELEKFLDDKDDDFLLWAVEFILRNLKFWRINIDDKRIKRIATILQEKVNSDDREIRKKATRLLQVIPPSQEPAHTTKGEISPLKKIFDIIEKIQFCG